MPDTALLELLLVILNGAISAGDPYARLLLAPPIPAGDPFTGSATGAMACYLWLIGLIKSPRFTAEQGHGIGWLGQAQVTVLNLPEVISGVRHT